jgi:hypothetical protein
MENERLARTPTDALAFSASIAELTVTGICSLVIEPDSVAGPVPVIEGPILTGADSRELDVDSEVGPLMTELIVPIATRD